MPTEPFVLHKTVKLVMCRCGLDCRSICSLMLLSRLLEYACAVYARWMIGASEGLCSFESQQRTTHREFTEGFEARAR